VTVPCDTSATDKRFWDRVREDEHGCWLWHGSLGSRGYGQVKRSAKVHRVHRYAWTLLIGPIPDGLMVLHDCDVKSCVRHLHLGTHSDNVKEAIERKRVRRRSGSQRRGSVRQRGAAFTAEVGHNRKRYRRPMSTKFEAEFWIEEVLDRGYDVMADTTPLPEKSIYEIYGRTA
jgi:hypothetical protein